jgi:hypothetical protein
MNKSEAIGELSKALTIVQSKLKGAKQDSNNPFFKSKYADLTSVWDACRGLLAANGLSVVQTTDTDTEHRLIVETMLIHSSGEWICGRMPMVLTKNDPQGIGSAITYGRRYGLAAIVGICPEDDDAESAVEHTPEAPQSKKSATKPAVGTTAQPAKQQADTRGMSDPKNIKKLGDLHNALYKDFKMMPDAALKELNLHDWSELGTSPEKLAEAYIMVATPRLYPDNK